MQASLLLRTA